MRFYEKIRSDAKNLLLKIRHLEGDPHFVALGLAIGVFVGVTPTIPFHTVLAVAFAALFKGSKAAAAIGVWFSNPVTIPVFYFFSYRTGIFLFGISSPLDAHPRSVLELMKVGLDLTAAMIAGGAALGVVPGLVAYFTVKGVLARWQEKRRSGSPGPGP